MRNIIGLKELRKNVNVYASEIKKGRSFIVVRRSKPLFKIVPPEDEEQWETVIDFREFYKGGIPASKLLKKLRAIE